jgi:heptaprenylglyceryl phosphate synthase
LVSEGKKKFVILGSSNVSDRALSNIVRQLEAERVSVKLLIFSHSADVVSNVELYLER